MAKRIILLSDGTGNAASKVWKSNVWRIFESLDLTGSEQVAFYDDGVGTSSFKPLAILGGVFGWGLKRNVLDIYKFLCANYTSDTDEIFGFGFSRGAFTMRVVMGLALDQGLVRGATDAEFYQNAKMAYRAYRANKFHTRFRIERPFRWVRDTILQAFGVRYNYLNNRPVNKVEFLGLWDTVAAYGLPIDEMARGVSKWIWPLELPDRTFNESIDRACHALALDDERTTFHPVLWNEKDVTPGKLSQVWFAGVHSNVGGGYPDDSLAHIPLYWIMKEAEARGLKFKTATSEVRDENPDPDMVIQAKWLRDKDGRLYDSRNGLSGYYRYGPRKIADLSKMKFSGKMGDEVANGIPTIHESAINRAKHGAHRYAPIGIPRYYNVLTDNGFAAQESVENGAEAEIRCDQQEHIWNIVWRRRIIYFVTVFASLYLLLYPLARAIPAAEEYSTRLSLTSDAIRLVANALPGIASPWVNAYARDPSHFLFIAFFVGLLIWLGSWLGGEIEDKMERVWRPATTLPGRSILGMVFLGFGAALSIYALAYPYLPSWLQLPANGHAWMISYLTTPVKIILASLLIALLLPNPFVFHLRSAGPYRWFIRFLKMEFVPLLFAVVFVVGGLLFASHVAFNLEDANGFVCTESSKIANADPVRRANSFGLGSCLSASIATCSPGAKEATCSGRRPVYCAGGGAASCETQLKPGCADTSSPDCHYLMPVCKVGQSSPPGVAAPAQTAVGPATCPAQCDIGPSQSVKLKINSACNATGIWLEQGQKYDLKVTPDGTWKDGDRTVSSRGIYGSDLPTRWDRFVAMFKWPLKRDFIRPPFRVIARVGSTGNDEYFLDPDSDPKAVNLDEQIRPNRSGELFLYVNESVFAWPSIREYFYKNNSGAATISVQRVRQ
jgi:hypothetical protein